MARINALFTRRRIAMIAFAIAGLLTVFFAVRLVTQAIYWNDPAHLDPEIANWMTPAYVGHAWKVPRPVIADAIGLPKEYRGKRLTLEEIAVELRIPFEKLKQQLDAAIAAHRNQP